MKIITIFQQLFTWLNGKKTNIGAAILIVAVAIPQVFSLWGYAPGWEQPLVQTLNYIGEGLGSTGLAHKIYKEKNGGLKK